MTLFVVAFFPIAAVVFILWLMLRPLADDPLAFREMAEPSVSFGAEDRAEYIEDTDPSGFPAGEKRQHRFGDQAHAGRANSQPTL